MANAVARCVKIGAALLLLAMPAVEVSAQTFQLPTANRTLFEKGGEEKFFVGTTGKPWASGTFGCVRSGGSQFHEGLDIRCLQRDKRGEPIDPVMATADGTVAYINARPALSTFGNYVILRHEIEGLEIYSTYAHLRSIRKGLAIGQPVKAGEIIGVMGRTAGTREGISKDRAHVHFELNLFINDRFPTWYKKTFPGQRNDHGPWNGRNLVGLDPRLIFLAQKAEGKDFNLPDFIRNQTSLCRVFVRAANFPWLKRCRALVRRNPVAEKEGVVGYEIALNFNGLAFELVPRAASEIKGKGKFQLLSVNEKEQQKNRCGRLVTKRGDRWELSSQGIHLLELLTHR